MVPPQKYKTKTKNNTCSSQTQTRFRDESESAHQSVDEMLSRAEVFSESGLGETLLACKAQVEVVCLSVSADAHHHQRNACRGLNKKIRPIWFQHLRGTQRQQEASLTDGCGILLETVDDELVQAQLGLPSCRWTEEGEDREFQQLMNELTATNIFANNIKTDIFFFTGRARFCTCEGPESVFEGNSQTHNSLK